MGAEARRKVSEEIKAILAPFQISLQASFYTAVALSLILVYLHQGSQNFFDLHLAGRLFRGGTKLEYDWWGMMYQFSCAFFLFLVVPLLGLKIFTRESFASLGLGFGDWKFGFGIVAPIGLILVALPGGWLAAMMSDFQAEYPMAKLAAVSVTRFLIFELAYGLLFYVSYELFFRGLFQHLLRRELGNLPAILIQTAITTLMHIGKPVGEVWSALVAGFLFGAIVLRIRSIWPVVIIHWALGVSTDFFCARAAGIL